MSELANRYEFVLLFDVVNGNPNGDPDAGNLPRVDPETRRGLITDVCLKRKVRNYIDLTKSDVPGFKIYVREKAVLSVSRAPAGEAVKGKAKNDAEAVQLAQKWMCENYFDVRAFGAVMSTKENNCGQVRGPVQFTFASSVDPIMPLDISITRMAVETQREADAQQGDNRTMGRKSIVPYGLYRLEGFVSAPLAKRTGFAEADLEALWEALVNMFEHDRSAARGLMSARKLVIFKHDSEIGRAPAHALFARITARRKDENAPVRSFDDYEVSVDSSNLPQGVSINEAL
ncbi:MAG: type I-C CRISPR-associated protein Cas7/Csd2 [Desulfovibrio sp.]|jgi:CRISPR-associated protein Csd2|nr:type I-C CRISPR-associated protein Cas7/Csd2 [Desulfovibrio sp.]